MTMSMLFASATSSRALQVTITGDIYLARSPIGPGDALNPHAWSVVDAESGEKMIVLASRIIPPLPPSPSDSNTCVELRILQPWVRYRRYTVNGALVKDETGALMTSPTSLTFNGAAPLQTPVQLTVQPQTTDIRNTAGPNQVSGSLEVGSDGDYANEGGKSLLKKLILRRILSVMNSFYHMPGYGLGVVAKDFRPASTLIGFQKVLLLEVQKEPEVETVVVIVSLRPNGIFFINVKAKLRRTGQNVSFEYALPLSNGSGA